MSTAPVCPQCGKPLPSDGPRGQCPACLLGAALAGQSDVSPVATVLPNSGAISSSEPEAGTRLKYFGDYELLDEIARGGMGVVWKARQTSLNRDVALKMIRAGALAGPEEVARFLREAEAAANLQHPNIVAIHEVGEHGGQHYFSMDYVAGRDLGTLVENGPLAPRVAARYVKIIAEAIHFAHQRGTLHRDLKPQNVLIDAGDQPRITDFGLAKFINDDSRVTQSGAVMGSPSYMPPEQAAGRQGDIGPASDVYSLGAMLYELLTGKPPFRGATAMATLRDVMESEPTAPRKLKADIPLDLETICLKCLEKSPSARYATAAALAEELDRFLRGEPIQARPAGAVRKVVSWTRRHPGALAAVAAFAIVTLAFGAFYLFEENALLRAQQANPSLTRVRGPRYESMQVWYAIDTFATAFSILLFLVLRGRARGLKFKDFLNRDLYARPLQPLGERTRTFAAIMGLISFGCGALLLVKTIEANVWEGESVWRQIGQVYLPIYGGLLLFSLVIGDYRLVHYGASTVLSIPDRELTAEQVAPIRQALEDHEFFTAVDRFREAVPEASRSEAKRYVMRLFVSLRAQYPEKFNSPPLSLATMNWYWIRRMALLEMVCLALLWLAAPPDHPISTVLQFASRFQLGMVLVAMMRVRGSRKLLLLICSGVVWALGEQLVRHLFETSPFSFGPYLCAVFFGTFLMVAAFNPRRRTAKA